MRPAGHQRNTERTGRAPGRRAELIGGPLDGGMAFEPFDPYAHFIVVPLDGSGRGPFPIYTYAYVPDQGRYVFCG